MKQQKNRKIEGGELVVGWLGFIDLFARIRPRKRKKAFVIGLPKTGTTSVHFALHKAELKAVLAVQAIYFDFSIS
ncbi:MAG: hypothetical protein GF398_08245 [Chitinivibrionales bacterium]|nr:hypothetical protein [Chitinivibrionales bacterium]